MAKAPISKKHLIRVKLGSKNGATMASLMKMTHWQEHSVRSALTMLRKSGYDVVCSKQGGKPSIYRIDILAAWSEKTDGQTFGIVDDA